MISFYKNSCCYLQSFAIYLHTQVYYLQPTPLFSTVRTMEATLEKVERREGTSFSVIDYSNPYFAAPLHIHPEYELILIEEGCGLSFVGDSIRKLQPGDFMLIGKNLPHLWLSADEYYCNDCHLISRSIYTQFSQDLFPNELSAIPELQHIQTLLNEARKGIYFSGENISSIKDYFRSMTDLEGFEKFKSLLTLLHRLGTECNHTLIASEKYINTNDTLSDHIINKVHLFINKNYQVDITLEDIANHVGMNPSALCRYYKKRTGRRMFEYLTELRISYAVKLLVNKSINISQIAYSCGYNSLSHFSHQFKSITGYTPSEYVKQVINA